MPKSAFASIRRGCVRKIGLILFQIRSPDKRTGHLVLATALAANAELIVSRDKHLRNLKHFHRIPILNATDALHRIEQQTRNGISN